MQRFWVNLSLFELNTLGCSRTKFCSVCVHMYLVHLDPVLQRYCGIQSSFAAAADADDNDDCCWYYNCVNSKYAGQKKKRYESNIAYQHCTRLDFNELLVQKTAFLKLYSLYNIILSTRLSLIIPFKCKPGTNKLQHSTEISYFNVYLTTCRILLTLYTFVL